MQTQIDADLRRASPVAAVGQQLNLIKAQRDSAERGFRWLAVRAVDDDDIARRIADAAREHGAERAQSLGRCPTSPSRPPVGSMRRRAAAPKPSEQICIHPCHRRPDSLAS